MHARHGRAVLSARCAAQSWFSPQRKTIEVDSSFAGSGTKGHYQSRQVICRRPRSRSVSGPIRSQAAAGITMVGRIVGHCLPCCSFRAREPMATHPHRATKFNTSAAGAAEQAPAAMGSYLEAHRAGVARSNSVRDRARSAAAARLRPAASDRGAASIAPIAAGGSERRQ
jgi:hypothetical protein